MISDEQRRMVAKELRGESESWRDTFPEATLEEEAIGASVMSDLMVFVELDDQSPVHEVYARLADLIDRSTCHDAGGGYTFECSECGCRIGVILRDSYEGEPAMTVHDDALYEPHYCPNCGAEVVE